MTDQSSDTKNKIIDVARVLFADLGYEGTSIREIAKSAEVNVASVHYHFSNKENLFASILRQGYLECSQAMRVMYESQHPSLEDTLIFLFRYFQNKSHDLITYFKMMMSTQHSHHLISEGSGDEMVGPPGGMIIIQAIRREVQADMTDEDLHWALKSLFSHVIHLSLMSSCCFKHNEIPYTSPDDIEKGIRRLTKTVLRELREGLK